MIVRSRYLQALLACAVTFVSGSGFADPSPAEISSARRAFERAVELENAGNWADASLKLREALAVKDTPGLRFHLAHCETEQSQLVEAALDYERASELIRAGAKAKDVQKLLAPASAALKPRIPRLMVELPADVLAAVPTLDGKVIPPSELGLGQAVDPGRHEIRVSASGRRTFQRSVTLKEGESVRIVADLPRVRALPALPTLPPTTTTTLTASVQPSPLSDLARSMPNDAASKRSSAKLFLMLGESAATAAGLVVGFAYKAAESSASDRIMSAQGRIDEASRSDVAACGDPAVGVSSACGDLSRAIDDHDHAAVLSTVGFITAGVGAAAFITTWLAYPSSRADSARLIHASRPSRLTVEPLVGPGRAGLTGRF